MRFESSVRYSPRTLDARKGYVKLSPMRQSEFDKINLVLDRAEFALEELRKKTIELRRKLAVVQTPEETQALNLESLELKEQLRRISEAVHAGSRAPHLRLVSDSE